MKNFRISIFIITLIFSSSCSNENVKDELLTVTEDEAVEIVEAALANQSAGVVETTYEYSKTYDEDYSLQDICNETITDSYEFNHEGSLVQAAYNHNWTTTLNCNTFEILPELVIPQSATFSASSSGSYSTLRLESDDASTFTSTVTGLGIADSEYIFNATYERIGTQTIKTKKNTTVVASDFSASLINLTVNKSDYKVVSGTGAFTLSGTTNGTDFTHEGNIIFNGDETATITINGNEHIVALN